MLSTVRSFTIRQTYGLELHLALTSNGNGNGTATIASDGPDHQDCGRNGKSYRLDITATSGAGTATQEFTLHITRTGASAG